MAQARRDRPEEFLCIPLLHTGTVNGSALRETAEPLTVPMCRRYRSRKIQHRVR